MCGRVGRRSLRTQQEDVGYTSQYVDFNLVLTKCLHQVLSLKVILRVFIARLVSFSVCYLKCSECKTTNKKPRKECLYNSHKWVPALGAIYRPNGTAVSE
jgi:hypothetical protein